MTPRDAYLHTIEQWDPAGTPTDVNADALLDSAVTVAETAVALAANKGRDGHRDLHTAHSQAVARLRQLIRLTDQVEAAQDRDTRPMTLREAIR